MKRLPLFALLFVLSCGQTEDSGPPSQAEPVTPYGPAAAVSEYRQQIEPHIRAVTDAQAVVEQGVGTTGQATAPNLAAAMTAARPDLQSAYERFQQIEPPLRLRDLHDKIGRLMICRLEAYTLTIDACKLDPSEQDAAAWRERVETQLAEANELIGQLNGELQAVDAALQAVTQQQVVTP
jgi:hypothetical protein